MILATDWVTVSSLATAGATLVLAFATFAAVRSANRAARAAERSMLAGIRPLLAPSRLEDPAIKVGFSDRKWFSVPGAGGIAEVGDGVVYLAMSVRNSGSGIAVLDSWYLHDDLQLGPTNHRVGHAPLGDFHRLTRDLYLGGGEIGFWQGTFRDPSQSEFAAAREAIEERRRLGIEILYGDQDGGQRTVSLFLLSPREDGAWMATVARHWNIDRPDPR